VNLTSPLVLPSSLSNNTNTKTTIASELLLCCCSSSCISNGILQSSLSFHFSSGFLLLSFNIQFHNFEHFCLKQHIPSTTTNNSLNPLNRRPEAGLIFIMGSRARNSKKKGSKSEQTDQVVDEKPFVSFFIDDPLVQCTPSDHEVESGTVERCCNARFT
jgi:hypothetical protein